jgi:hypothetical protein
MNVLKFLPILAIFLVFAMPVNAVWYNTSYANKIQFNITNNVGASLTNFPIVINATSNLSIGFNTQALILAGKLQSDCDDFLIVNGTENGEFKRYIENATCNTTNTIVTFVGNLSTGVNNFYLYYNSVAAANTQNKRAVLSQLSGDYSWFDFDEGSGTTTYDSGRIANNGTLTLASFNNTGRGYALGLWNAGADYDALGAKLTNGTATYTIEFWMYPANVQNNPEAAVFSDQSTGGSNGMVFENATINGSAGYHFFYGNAGGSDWEFIPGIFPNLLQWNHIVIVRNTTNVTIYLNGASAVSQLKSSSVALTTNNVFYLGRFSGTANRYWNGTLDGFNMRMGYVMPAGEVKARYDGLSYVYGTEQQSNVPPVVTILLPSNATSNRTLYVLNFTATDNDGIDRCWWIDALGTNSSLPSCANTTFLLASDGYYNVTVYANDTTGIVGSSIVFFTRSSYPQWYFNSTNSTRAGENTTFSLYWNISSGSALDGYSFTWCNGLYNKTNQTCGNVTTVDNMNLSNPSFITSNNYDPTESQESMVKTSDGTIWKTHQNSSFLYLWNSSNNGTTWNFVRQVDTIAFSGDKSHSIAMNSSDVIWWSYADGSNAYVLTYDTRSSVWGSRKAIGSVCGSPRTSIQANGTDAMFVAFTCNTAQVTVARSSDGGVTWANSTISMDSHNHVALTLYIDRFNHHHLIDMNRSSSQQIYSFDYYNSTDGITWGGWTRLSPIADDGMSDIYVDENGNRHIMYTMNGVNLAYNSYLWYMNSTGNGAFSTPINLTSNATIAPDVVSLTQGKNKEFVAIFMDGARITGHWQVWSIRAPAVTMRWNLTLINNNSAFQDLRGQTFPVQNSNDNSDVFDATLINKTSPFALYYFNITSEFAGGNISWLSEPFKKFVSSNWSNTSEIVVSGDGKTVAWFYVANSTRGLSAQSPIFYYDTTSAPSVLSISIQSPINDTGYNYSTMRLNYTVSGVPDRCWYVLDANASVDLPSCANTTFETINGTHMLAVYGNNTDGVNSSSSISFYVDTHNPVVTIINPEDGEIFNTTNITLEYSALNSIAVDSCWYILNGGPIVPLTSCGNITFLGAEGNNNITVYANDTANNTGFHSHLFLIDTIAPVVAVQSPTGNHNTRFLPLNYTASDVNLVSCWYAANLTYNVTLGSCSNVSFSSPEGVNITVTVYAIDIAGNIGAGASVYSDDYTAPSVVLLFPLNSTYFNTTLNVNYSVSDVRLSVCRMELDGVNTTLVGCANTTLVNLSYAQHTLKIYANDTFSNSNSSSRVRFTVSLFVPPVTPPITGSTAIIVGFLPLLLGVGLIVVTARRIDEMESTEDFVAVIIGIGLGITFLGVFVAIIGGLI